MKNVWKKTQQKSSLKHLENTAMKSIKISNKSIEDVSPSIKKTHVVSISNCRFYSEIFIIIKSEKRHPTRVWKFLSSDFGQGAVQYDNIAL